ncbi:Lebercilin-like protein [Ooceraea biroi]|uniref:Lebercilin-like protein n=1 Tax=Ooceraea biroi TaxID=2015173 RepID=A0A026VX89_OOCBI|nr:Lebercilin-like protein [Ooceraea biroi]
MSAKMLRFKQLQNQLADAHYHLNELANENRLLKALQKRQDSALRRYEGTNAELPRLINSHHEELRVLQTKYKKLKELHKDTCNLLKEKESELHSVNSQNRHLLQLSKDRNLEEREKLQLQLSDMNHRMQQQEETIQLLHRKLALETKSLKHQLHTEISKHKETQKNLQETIEKLKTLECLLDNREKRLYYNGQLPIYNKEKNLGSHSLTNLRDSISNAMAKVSSRSKKSENGMPKDNLPSLDTVESNDDEKTTLTNNVNHDHSVDYLKSETMTSLQQIRKFRLQTSANIRKNAYSMDDLRFKSKDSEIKANNNENIAAIDFKTLLERNNLDNETVRTESGKLRKLFSRMKNRNSLQNELKIEYGYSSDDGESENASEHHIGSYATDIAQKSRALCTRLLSSTDDTSDTLDDIMKTANIHYSDEEEEELNTYLTKDLAFQKHKYKSKLRQLQHHKGKELYNSSSDIESEERIDANENSSTLQKHNSFQANSSKEQCSRSFNSVHPNHGSLEIREQSIIEKLKDAELPEISDNNLETVSTENIEASQRLSNAKQMWLEEHHFLENNKTVDNSLVQDIKEGDCTNKEAKCSENKIIHTDTLYDKIYHDAFKQDNAHEEMRILSNLERKETEDNPKPACEKESVTNHSNENNHPVYNLGEDYPKTRLEEMPSVIDHNDGDMLNKSNFNIETKNKLNASSEAEDTKIHGALPNNVYASQIEQSNETKDEVTNTKQTADKKRVINYNKEKLLATMKAIDDNENIEFLNQAMKNHSMMNRMQITENLYRGLPTHSRAKRDIIKDIFEDNHIDNNNRTRSTCSKSH